MRDTAARSVIRRVAMSQRPGAIVARGFFSSIVMNIDAAVNNPFYAEVTKTFGILPNFFCTALSAPGLMEELWGFARATYIDNPLPALFKERLLVHLSRFCRIRYCVTRHVGFLIDGRPAGDPFAPVQNIEQALALLRRPTLDDAALQYVIETWASREPCAHLPDPETQDEAELFDILTFIFLNPMSSSAACRAVRNSVGDCHFELLVAFLALVRTLHFWTETHPELEIEPDMVARMQANPELDRLLRNTREAEEASLDALRGRLAATESALEETARMEKAVRESEATLKEADRRKDEFIATLAHELRNPLAPIHNATFLLRTKLGAGDAAAPLVDVIQRQTDHLMRLVDDLMEVSRISRGRIELRKEPVDLATVTRDALESCEPLIQKKAHRVSYKVPNTSLWVCGDRVRLTQIIVNLLNNAVKYTPPGGTIEIETARENNEIMCRVRDNGIGIAPDNLARVFDLFAQINAERMAEGGLGIGLALVRKLVEMHNGRIEARSVGLGRGSEFIVWLPADEGPYIDAAGEIASGNPRATRVLVIDDNRDVGETFKLLLESQGAIVRFEMSGPSGLAIIETFQPQLIFLDIGMPGMDGYETARRLRQIAPDRSFLLVALTGWGLDEDRRLSREAGFDLHITKPATIEVVRELLIRAGSAPSKRLP